MLSKYKTYPLGNFIEQIRGVSYKKSDVSEVPKEGYIPLLRANNIQAGKLVFSDVIYVKKELVRDSQLIKKDDIVIAASSGSKEVVGKSGQAHSDYDCSFGAFCKLIRAKENINPRFLGYFFKTDYYSSSISNSVNGANINNLRNEHIDNLLIPIPSVSTQEKIANVLDKAQELIDKRKAQIEALDQLTQSVFLEMFGNLKGEKVPLSELCDVNPSKKEIENIDKELPVTFLPMAKVSENGELDLSESRLIKEVFDGFTYFREGDVLFAKITPCMENGKGAIARNLINNIGFGSTEFHVLRPKENVNSTWLYYLTSLQSFRKQAEANMTGSAGQKRVPKQFFSKYKVVLPPIELQNQFAEIVHKIQSQKEIMKKSLEELENNFNSLMQQAFKGELFND